MQKIKDYIYYNRKEIITILICFISFISFILFNKSNNSEIVEDNIEIVNTEETNKKIIIDIKGEVKNPGTYEFNDGERIMDAVNRSGGLTDKANVDTINLSEKLTDEMLIVIPSIEEKEIVEDKEEKKQEVIKENKTSVNDNKISINTADINKLMTLNGIGRKKAEAIIEYREKNGLFKDIKDITKVSGIGSNIFDKIKDYIKV